MSYSNNKRIALSSYLIEDDEPYGFITINLDIPISDIDEGFIDSDIESSNLVPILKELGIIKESYGFIQYNYGTYEYVKFDLNKLKEYDKKGVEEYIKIANKNSKSILLGNENFDLKI